jgi:hypothetical protein
MGSDVIQALEVKRITITMTASLAVDNKLYLQLIPKDY